MQKETELLVHRVTMYVPHLQPIVVKGNDLSNVEESRGNHLLNLSRLIRSNYAHHPVERH